ncbi:MAG: prepilin peptidase [Planctomycetes bacterium]|nr:prepilin peptidase [Planctomycetota bacterium]
MDHFFFIWVGFAFALGAAIGSWLNVCIYRVPYEKSLLWPGSHCGHCFQRVRWYDNIPLISYWVLRGRCRTCKTPFSIRYFLIELFTGLVFAGLFYLDIGLNVQGMDFFRRQAWRIQFGWVPVQAWLFWLGHAVLVSFLIVASVIDLDHMEIPLPVTVTGTLTGLVFATCMPWPWPNTDRPPLIELRLGKVVVVDPVPVLGFQPWPLWRPDELPKWMPPGSWQLGLATGLAGVLAGVVLVRGVRFLFGLGRGLEGMGLGDADLMMMAGAFLGWQATLVAFFVSVFPGLVLGLGQVVLRGSQTIPFGPSLALGIVLTLYGWRWIGPQVQVLFFDSTLLLLLGGTGAVLLLVVSLMLRLLFGAPPPEDDERPAAQG